MSFDLPWILWLAPAVGLGFWGLARIARRRRIQAASAWSAGAAAAARWGPFGPFWVALGVLAITVGIAGPRFGSADVDTETRALNIVFAIDISRSMLAEDALPSRLGRAIGESRRLLHDARGDRMALLAFAGRSYILTPLTLDDGAVELQLDALEPDIASEGGTALAAVLNQGGQLLAAASEGGARAMVLMTDGEAHDSLDQIREAARGLQEAGVTLIVIGQGGVTPARIPIRDDAGQLLEYKKDDAGNEVLTARRDEMLRSIADAAQGILTPADSPDQAGAAWKTLASLDRDPATGRRTEDLRPRAWIAALGALVLLFGQGAWGRRAALVGVVGLLASSEATAQRPAGGTARLRGADTTRAVDEFRRAATSGSGADTSWYNAGSVALATGQLDVAREALGAAGRSLDPVVRFQSLYNLGLASLREARSDSAKRGPLEREAADRFREALLLSPASAAAKWNLELTSRRQPPSSSQPKPQPQRPQGGAGQPAPRSEGMTAAEAEQILRSVERSEQAVRTDQLRRRRVARGAQGKDW